MHELDTIARSSTAAAAQLTPDPALVRARAGARRTRRRAVTTMAGIAILVGLAALALSIREPSKLVDTANEANGTLDDTDRLASSFDPMTDIPEPWNVVVFFRADATDAQITNVKELLRSSAAVGTTQFVTKQETFEEFREHFADDPKILDTISVDTMPPSIRLNIDHANSPILATIENTDGVRTVVVSEDLPRSNIPSLLLEAPTPVPELHPRFQDIFDKDTIREDVARLDPDLTPSGFETAYVVERSDVTIAVGLDRSGTLLCVATMVVGSDDAGASCASPAEFMRDRSISVTHTGSDRTVGVVFVPDGVVAIDAGGKTANVEHNIAVLEGSADGVVAVDGGPTRTGETVLDPSLHGQLTIEDVDHLELEAMGCSRTADYFMVDGAFSGDTGLIVATVTPAGVALSGGLDVADTRAVIETSVVDGSLVATATWRSETRSGTLQIDCGDRLLDLSSIR